MELKENMFVRTNEGYIAKITELEHLDYHDHLSDTIWFDGIIRVDYGDEFSHINPIDRDIIKKASFNLIDLVELGDYVNGHKVVSTPFYDSGYITFGLSNNTNFDNLIPIKEILTHEMYNANKYEVGK